MFSPLPTQSLLDTSCCLFVEIDEKNRTKDKGQRVNRCIADECCFLLRSIRFDKEHLVASYLRSGAFFRLALYTVVNVNRRMSPLALSDQ